MRGLLFASLLCLSGAEPARAPLSSERAVVKALKGSPPSTAVLDPQLAQASRWSCKPLELHSTSQMPIVRTLLLQAAVLLSVLVCFLTLPRETDFAKVCSWLFGLLAMGLYVDHCRNCYPAQLIRRRIDSMEPVDQVGSTTPTIRWKARAYHFETRWHRVTTTDSKGNTRTRWESHQEEVVTWVADVLVPALQWSYEERRAGRPGKQPWTSVRADFRVCAADPEGFDRLRSEFQSAHDRDEFLDFTETVATGRRVLTRDISLTRMQGYAWTATRFYLLVSQQTVMGTPTLLTWVLVCMMMISAPYQAWIAARMKVLGASAAVEYTRSFKLDVNAAREQLNLGVLMIEAARARENSMRWRGLRLLTCFVAAAL